MRHKEKVLESLSKIDRLLCIEVIVIALVKVAAAAAAIVLIIMIDKNDNNKSSNNSSEMKNVNNYADSLLTEDA